MSRTICFLLFGVAIAAFLVADDQPVVFHSDVSLIRVDVQVVDRDNRAITGLRATDFVLREEGRVQEIRNFASENMPVDVLLLLDVSGSMRPHVQRISSAAHAAFQVLAKDDRIAIMVFDRTTRVRLNFRSDKSEVERELDSLIRQERFNSGTDINGALLDAASYVGREGRRDARRAIVILTDDEARQINFDAVDRELARSDAVLSLLLAPRAMMNRGVGNRPGGGYPGSRRGPLGGIILGPQGRIPTNGPGNGPVGNGGPNVSAGTADVARSSGGDTMPVDDAYALETTLTRIRQRYGLYFNLPPGVRAGDERNIRVELADAADRRYPGAEARYRRVYLAPISTSGSSSDPVSVSRSPTWRPVEQADTPRSRPRGDLSTGPRNGPLQIGQDDRNDPPSEPAANPAPPPPPAANPPAQPSQDSNQGGGWRQLKPGEKP